MRVEYVRKDGLRLDVRRQAGKRLNLFRVTQGACSDGKYIYMAFERKKSVARARAVRIVKLDPDAMRIVRISGVLKIGHANDMTYRDGILYITHSFGSKVIHRVDAVTLKKQDDIGVRAGKAMFFNGIAKLGSGFLIRNMFGPGLIQTDRNFRALRYFNADGKHKVSQCMEVREGIIYRTYSDLQTEDRNYLVTFDLDGNMLSDSKVEMMGELEGCFMHKGELWFTSYRKKEINGSLRCMAFIGKAVWDGEHPES